ncbi:MAG: ATP-dependent RecD-like DNA helicase [Deltaproteobacteria bacterium]|nr:ATP-dependent RecD-like DNA helicase [Deltaproteobacteria bacterium]
MPETFSGQIEKVIFHSPDNGFSVVSFKVKKQGLITLVGNLGSPAAGELLEVRGDWVNHKSFGPRFEVSSFTAHPPDSPDGLTKYLGSGLIPGIGPVLAQRMVRMFQERVLEVLDNEPERLTEVPGLGKVKREKIIEAWRTVAGLKRLLKFLAVFGVGPALAQKIMRRLGSEAENLIKANPYRLAFEIQGVGFKTADNLALSLGRAEDSPERLEAALLYLLAENERAGHACANSRDLVRWAKEMIPAAKPAALEVALSRVIVNGQAIPLNGPEPGVQDIYAPRLFRAECWVARDLQALIKAPPTVRIPRVDSAVAWVEKTLDIALNSDQRQAVLAALQKKVVVITGGPGTGKTTIAKAICRIWREVTPKIALCAPTGRAAKRLSQATGFTATTIHRLLEYSPQGQGFARGPNNRLELDFLLVDEASMLDILVANPLLGALPKGATLVIIGDSDQLPPVGPGQVLKDIMESGVIPTVRLKTIYRQANQSQIVLAAGLINQGQAPEAPPRTPDSDFFYVEDHAPEGIKDKILRLVLDRVPRKLKVNPLTDIQVLSPINKGELGVDSLNQILGAALNPEKSPALNGGMGRSFKKGDKVIQIRNNYRKGVYNGDLGFVAQVDLENQELIVDFEGEKIAYQVLELEDLRPAWALTVHKAQGSEFPVIIMPIHLSHARALRRKLLYTAVTRGKRMVMLIGQREALRRAALDVEENQRRGNLRLFLTTAPPPVDYAEALKAGGPGVLEDDY